MRSPWFGRVAAAAFLAAAAPLAAPKLLAFPYSARIAGHDVRSVAPIGPGLARIVADADAAVRRSPIGSARPLDQSLYLTDGGWRWTWLSAGRRAAFAVSKPVTEAIVVNRTDFDRNIVLSGAAVAGRRSLSGTLAHEMTHGAIRARFGLAADWRYPAALREGYCDFVAGGGSLSDAQAHALEAQGRDIPALGYWRGRKKVEALLAANRGDVDALFANWPN